MQPVNNSRVLYSIKYSAHECRTITGLFFFFFQKTITTKQKMFSSQKTDTDELLQPFLQLKGWKIAKEAAGAVMGIRRHIGVWLAVSMSVNPMYSTPPG